MSTDIEKGTKTNADSGSSKPSAASAGSLTLARLNPIRLGWAFGVTGLVFYLGCVLTMATVPHERAVVFFNSLMHGINVEPILQTDVPIGEVVLGLITTFVLGWFAGVLVAGFYNFGFRASRSEHQGRAL